MRWKFAELVKMLSGLYYNQEKIAQLLILSGFSPGEFDLHDSAYTSFTLLIKKLEQLGIVDRVLTEVQNQFPGNILVGDILKNIPEENWHSSVYSGPDPDFTTGEKRIDFETITRDVSSLLPISFLSMGIQKARSVARIVTPHKLGTGFLIADSNILLTNNHVINSRRLLSETTVFFNYQKDINDRIEKSESFELDKDFFYTSADNDWAIVRVAGNPVERFGYIDLVSSSVSVDDCVNIIQHPGGEYKQISLYHNVVAYADENRIRYLTDTLPGSSGAPVFDSNWQVVALHHSGGYFPAKNGSKVLCNQGININKVIEGVSEFTK